MSEVEPKLEELAITRLRDALTEADVDPDEIDDDELVALARGELPPARATAALELLSKSAALRAYIVEVSRPVDDVRAARAAAVMGAPLPAPTTVDPFADPLAPEPPRGFVVTGPFGRIRAAMDSRAESADMPRFGPGSDVEWRIHADHTGLPSEPSLWRRIPGGDYARVRAPQIEHGGGAMRVRMSARDLFPAPGVWHLALLFGHYAHPGDVDPGDTTHLFERVVRFDLLPGDDPL